MKLETHVTVTANATPRVWHLASDFKKNPFSRRQRTDIGKYSFVNRTIQLWNQLPAEVLGILPYKPITFIKRVRKVIIELNLSPSRRL